MLHSYRCIVYICVCSGLVILVFDTLLDHAWLAEPVYDCCAVAKLTYGCFVHRDCNDGKYGLCNVELYMVA